MPLPPTTALLPWRGVRSGVWALLALLGLAGAVQLPLAPPLASRTGAATERVLADLAGQEAVQDARQRATQVLSRFVGGEITRYFWGGFTPYLDVLGIEAPEDMRASLQEGPQMVQLILQPEAGGERFVARVQAHDNVPRGVACRGTGAMGSFHLAANQLHCPPGWELLELPGRQRGGV